MVASLFLVMGDGAAVAQSNWVASAFPLTCLSIRGINEWGHAVGKRSPDDPLSGNASLWTPADGFRDLGTFLRVLESISTMPGRC
jgi:hypothetical protein